MPTTVIEKQLSANDVGETGAHQAGIYVGNPRTIPDFFPSLDKSANNPQRELEFVDDEGRSWNFMLVYWNQGTRNEYPLTRMTDFFNRQGARSGDYLVLSRERDGTLRARARAGTEPPAGPISDRVGAWDIRSVPDSDPEEDYTSGLPEGAKRRVEVNRYERSSVNRSRCLEVHGYDCAVCGMSFAEEYGKIGEEYIEVHHIIPLAELGEDYNVDPVEDLAPVCPNCHRMLHRRNPPFTVEEMREIRRERGVGDR